MERTREERAEALYQATKADHETFTVSQRALANVTAEFMHDFGALLGTTIPPDFKRFAQRLQVLHAVTASFNDSKCKLEASITVSLHAERSR